MREERFVIELDEYEHSTMISCLNEWRKKLKREGRSTEEADDLIIKVGFAPQKRMRVIEREQHSDEAR